MEGPSAHEDRGTHRVVDPSRRASQSGPSRPGPAIPPWCGAGTSEGQDAERGGTEARRGGGGRGERAVRAPAVRDEDPRKGCSEQLRGDLGASACSSTTAWRTACGRRRPPPTRTSERGCGRSGSSSRSSGAWSRCCRKGVVEPCHLGRGTQFYRRPPGPCAASQRPGEVMSRISPNRRSSVGLSLARFTK